MYRSTKTYQYLPCAHRQWRDQGHCQYIHGYDRTVKIEFQCKELDDKHWVMDFGALKEVKEFLEYTFDHTLLINADDPQLEYFLEMDRLGLCQLRVLPNIGMEGSAKYIFDWVEAWLKTKTSGRVQVYSVECRENDKNSAIYFRED